MKWSKKQRLEFIEKRLFWENKITRKEVMDYFDTSIAQTTNDFNAYKDYAPENIDYDPSLKCYVQTKKFSPKFFKPSGEGYLKDLYLSHETNLTHSIYGEVPLFEIIPNIERAVSVDVLKEIIFAINNNMVITIEYQSMNNPIKHERRISPHALVFDGTRWHTRAYCFNHNCYKDFSLGRILNVKLTTKCDLNHRDDLQWFTLVNLKLVPNTNLTHDQKKLIELEFSMDNGVKEIGIRAAFLHYYIAKYRLKEKNSHLSLINEQELKQKLNLLTDLSLNRIN